jgi:hypothetical protein
VTLACVPLEEVAEEFSAAVQQMPWAPEVGLRNPDGNWRRIACQPPEQSAQIP